MNTDPIADLLTRIRNAARAKKTAVSVPASHMKRDILKVLQERNFIGNVEEDSSSRSFKIGLKYYGEGHSKVSVISDLKRVSKPGCRVYVQKEKLPSILGEQGVAIISTSQGVMSSEQARDKKLGGEHICSVF
ncbi:MAG TPA: 30S ribosomal protein S8 [Bdellovibrionota bacterium]|nr:30S ribosomal protein S8 [Bdellovibrionota bacterium]